MLLPLPGNAALMGMMGMPVGVIRLGEMEVEHQRQVIGGPLCQRRTDDPRVADDDGAYEGFVKRSHRQPRRKRSKPAYGHGDLMEACTEEDAAGELVPPIVAVADHQGRIVA